MGGPAVEREDRPRRRPSLNERLLAPAPTIQGAGRLRRPSADSIFAARLQQQSHKRPTFGLDMQPDAAAAFDCIPSPHIIKGPVGGSKSTSLSGSRRSVASMNHQNSAVAGLQTAGSSLSSGTDPRPTSQGEHGGPSPFLDGSKGARGDNEMSVEGHSHQHDGLPSSPVPVFADAPLPPIGDGQPNHGLDQIPAETWYAATDFPEDPHGHTYDSLYGDIDEERGRLELLEDIQEHPSISPIQSTTPSPLLTGSEGWNNVAALDDTRRPSDPSSLSSGADPTLIQQGIPRSVRPEDGSPADGGVISIDMIGAKSGPSNAGHAATSRLPATHAAQSQKVVDVRTFDWL